MKIQDVIAKIKDVPHMSAEQGMAIYNMILNNDIVEILELGFAHGTSSCYMGAALHEKGKGQVTTIDNKSALQRKPNIHELLNEFGFTNIKAIFSETTYNWELMKIIEKQTINNSCKPIFDFCYIDGAHNFEIDTCAFFLVDKLLKPGGYILFDDLKWTYAESPALKDTKWVNSMPEDEKKTAHVEKITNLIVKQHPNYENFQISNNWFLARKKISSTNSNNSSEKIRLNQYYKDETVYLSGIKGVLKKLF